MQHFDYLIVGGGIAGTTAAETIRQYDAGGSIAIVNDEVHPLYSRVMLSKPEWFLGRISFDHIWLKHPGWYVEHGIAYLAGQTAVKLDPTQKVLTLKDGLELGYGKLLLAPGASVRRWTIPGADKRGIYAVKTLDDGAAIIDAIATKKRAVTVGGGFISFEMDDLFRLKGLEVTHLIRESYYWEPLLDGKSGRMIETAIEKGGVRLLRNAEAQEVVGGASVEGLILTDGMKLDCDMIVCGIGTYAPIEWLRPAGLAVGRGILTNEYLETNLPDVWAAGDAAEFKDTILDENVQLGNWVNATEHGRTAGKNMTGKHELFVFVSFYTTQGLGISIAFAGDVRVFPDRTIIERGSPELNSYARVILKGNEVEGATMMNRTKELTTLAKLIRMNVDVSGAHTKLADPNFDLKQLVPQPAATPTA